MLYAMQIDENSLRIFNTVARDDVSIDLDGKLTHHVWPPKEAVELSRKPEQGEILKIVDGKEVFIKLQVSEPLPSLEDRIEELERKLE